MSQIFVSYARADFDRAKLIVETLENSGYSVWWDDDLTPERQFDDIIQSEIDEAEAVLVLWSQTSVDSAWVRSEVTYGKDKLIPAKIETCKVPLAFNLIQTANLVDWSGDTGANDWLRLVSWLNARISDTPSLPTPPSPLRTATSGPDTDEPHLGRSESTQRAVLVGLALACVLGLAFWVGNRAAQDCLLPLPDARTLRTSDEAPVTDREGCKSQEFAVYRDCEDCPPLVSLPPGTFQMGASEADGGETDERPMRDVTLRKPFAIGRFEVTWREWLACEAAGACDSYGNAQTDRTGDLPVYGASYEDAQKYTGWLSRQTGFVYRLPTEAEWEYAARAGSPARYSTTIASAELCEFANVLDREGREQLDDSAGSFPCSDGQKRHARIGQYRSNAFGLFDTLGNVREWVQDCYRNSYTNASKFGDPVEHKDCQQRVARGGSFADKPRRISVTYRYGFVPQTRRVGQGFRVVREL